MAWQVYCFSVPPRRLCSWVDPRDDMQQRCVCFPRLVPRNLKRIFELYLLTPNDIGQLARGIPFRRDRMAVTCSETDARGY